MANHFPALQRISNAHVVTPDRILPGGEVEDADGRIARGVEFCNAGVYAMENDPDALLRRVGKDFPAVVRRRETPGP